MSQSFANKTALVTGASRGIGRATAERLSADGAHVLIHYGRSQDEAESLRDSIRSAGGSADTVQADLAQPEGVAQLAAKTGEWLGERSLDILINNAGIAEYVDFEGTDAVIIDRLFAVNVRAPFLLTSSLFDRLADNGSIVFASSIVSKTSFSGIPAYAITKGAIDTLVLHLASHLGPRGIRVNAVAPGAIATDMSSWLESEDGAAQAHAMQALQRIGQPEDVARVAAFLAGPDSGWVTGQVIDVSGGSKL